METSEMIKVAVGEQMVGMARVCGCFSQFKISVTTVEDPKHPVY
jgi:hypothetical protein